MSLTLTNPSCNGVQQCNLFFLMIDRICVLSACWDVGRLHFTSHLSQRPFRWLYRGQRPTVPQIPGRGTALGED